MTVDIITENSIKNLVNQFYKKIRADNELSPIFISVIGKEDEQWKPHLERMYDFWSSIMLTSGRYHGTPMQKHKALPSFDEALFDRWLVLFAETAHEMHCDDIAQRFIDRSQIIAESLKLGIACNERRKNV